MKLRVFGPGCRNCERLYENALTAVGRISASEGQIEVEKVKELDEMYKMGIFVTPALAIDDEVEVSGKVLSPEQIEAAINKHLIG